MPSMPGAWHPGLALWTYDVLVRLRLEIEGN